jgi:hypothetical protein
MSSQATLPPFYGTGLKGENAWIQYKKGTTKDTKEERRTKNVFIPQPSIAEGNGCDATQDDITGIHCALHNEQN